MTATDRGDDGRRLVDTVDPGAKDQPAEGGRAEAEDGGSARASGPGSPAAQESGVVERGPQPEAVMRDDADPGAYVGRLPEGQAETIPGGVDERDERVSAYDSRREDVNEPDAEGAWPSGHREGDQASDDDIREAGRNQ